MATSKLLKLESAEILQNVLEVLNAQPYRYIPFREIEEEFNNAVNKRKKYDAIDIRNKLQLTLTNATGLNDQLQPHMGVDTTSHLADIAAIWQTKLVIYMRLPLEEKGKKTEQECYMISFRGVEILNSLKNTNNTKRLARSSKILEVLTAILSILTAALIYSTIFLKP